MRATEARAVAALFLLLAFASLSGVAAADGGGPGGGWGERSLGWLTSLPERRVTATDNGIEGDFSLAPGTGIALERALRAPGGRPAPIRIVLFADNVNNSSRDYEYRKTHFPISVTVVFGEDRQPLTARRRVRDFFSNLWRGFPPRGIRIVYAWGNRVPAGSMYRTTDEEAVFTLAGAEEAGREVSARRDPAQDFLAAYGRPPKGPVTRLIVRAARPRAETGALRARVAATFPAP